MIRPRVRAQIRREIRAQFEAFHATGLALDHVNAHQHYHLHPAILADVIAIGRDYGMKALRVPVEPIAALRSIEPTSQPLAAMIARPWAALSAWRARRAQLIVADRIFGFAWSGGMTESRLAGLIERLPAGSTEIYTHPATADRFAGSARGYRYKDELAALLAASTRHALERSGAILGGYSDMADTALASVLHARELSPEAPGLPFPEAGTI